MQVSVNICVNSKVGVYGTQNITTQCYQDSYPIKATDK